MSSVVSSFSGCAVRPSRLKSMSLRQLYLWLLEGSLSVALVGANGYIDIGHMRFLKIKGESHCGSRLCLLLLIFFSGCAVRPSRANKAHLSVARDQANKGNLKRTMVTL